MGNVSIDTLLNGKLTYAPAKKRQVQQSDSKLYEFYLLKMVSISKQTALEFKNEYRDNKDIIKEDNTIIQFLFSFLYKAIFSISTHHIQPEIKYEVICDTQLLTLDFLRNALGDIEVRKSLFKSGSESAIQFLSKISQPNEPIEPCLKTELVSL